MKSFQYTIRIHPPTQDSPGYWVEVPALPGCFTQGRTYAEAVANAHEAIEGFIEALVKAGQPIPEEDQPQTALLDAVRVEAEVGV